MRHQQPKVFITLLFIIATTFAFAQEGIVSGTINSEIDGLPLPGVNIIVKGTTRGVQTDFDGNYSIKCRVGEVLIFSFVSMTTKEVRVTSRMFGEDVNDNFIEQIPIKPIESDAYKNAIKNGDSIDISLPSLNKSQRTYNKVNNFQYAQIKDIKVNDKRVDISYFNSDIYFEVGFNNNLSLQYYNKRNLPKLQSTYAQGASLNSELTFLGPETGNPFSYGPRISALEFDGTNYPYDINGKLVALGNGNGISANRYDNSILETIVKSSNNLFFNVSSKKTLIELDYNRTQFKDIFNQEKSTSNDITLSFKHGVSGRRTFNWKGFAKYGYAEDNQPNINGFLNNSILNAWATPVSFNNNQGPVISDNTQRRFNSNFDNPNWSFKNNRNNERSNFFIGNLQTDIELSTKADLKAIINYTRNQDYENFGLNTSSAAFEDGYLSQKSIKRNVFNSSTSLKFIIPNDAVTKITSKLDFSSEHLDYSFNESTGFDPFSFSNPQNTLRVTNKLNRHVLRVFNRINHDFYDAGIEINLGNNSYYSSIQNDKWLLPFLELKLNFIDLFDIDTYDIDDFGLNITTAYDVNDTPLFYNNKSHNSLGLLPIESLAYTANNDLFLNRSIQLEENNNYAIDAFIEFNLLETFIDFGISYYNNKTKGSVFPVLENESFNLKNIADIRNQGVEISLSTNIDINGYRTFYRPSFSFSSYRTKVLKIHSDQERIPVAGFSSVSKNLIVGERAGVIVGSAYARDSNNAVIIDDEGFPMVAAEQQIIGDPTPDFNIGFTNKFQFKNLQLSFVLDFQKGGDVWDGTQNTLNYLGRSQQSANERNITDFIFQGVNQQGQQNTIPVDFYNPLNDISQNRFVRYGFSGVAEDAIKDASYINLRSIDVNYTFDFNPYDNRKTFIRELNIGLYAQNLITWTKFDGASPYRNLYDSASAQGLNFFNLPITSEIGFKLNFKI